MRPPACLSLALLSLHSLSFALSLSRTPCVSIYLCFVHYLVDSTITVSLSPCLTFISSFPPFSVAPLFLYFLFLLLALCRRLVDILFIYTTQVFGSV